ncbi:WAS/WASL-interacting protein family member 3-like [Parus major]|uniref:WAS/WASL-interacting protein family member 3-like n=1 Tax=Parus major TaxID=9157 RepID=UPI00144415B2|nr:WAS/WASL-interacting protein family member 3-like [Parus major]
MTGDSAGGGGGDWEGGAPVAGRGAAGRRQVRGGTSFCLKRKQKKSRRSPTGTTVGGPYPAVTACPRPLPGSPADPRSGESPPGPARRPPPACSARSSAEGCAACPLRAQLRAASRFPWKQATEMALLLLRPRMDPPPSPPPSPSRGCANRADGTESMGFF